MRISVSPLIPLRAVLALCLFPFLSNLALATEFEGFKFSGSGQAEVTQHLGRDALKLTGGRLWFDGRTMQNGVIEFDFAVAESTTFLGTMFRAASTSHFENVYFRAHLNNKPDAMQYMPVENGVSSWQIFSDANAIAPVSFDFNGWNRAKIVVIGGKTEIYLNSEQPVLHVPDLKTDIAEGKVGLWMFSADKQPAYFSNIQVKALATGDKLVASAKEVAPLHQGLIPEWRVSEPISEASINQSNRLAIEPDDLDWQKLAVETNGIANLAKLSAIEDDKNTVLIRMDIGVSSPEVRRLHFGYSDRVQIFLNGDLIFAGNAGWKQRDYRYLGTVGLLDSVGLPLNKGKNQLVVAVSESFGGWAWTGAWAE